MCIYIHHMLMHVSVYVCTDIYMYFKLCLGPNLGLNCCSNPAVGACSRSPQPALPRSRRLSPALLHAHPPALAPAAPKRDKPATSPTRPADKASCEDVLSLPVFLPHTPFLFPVFSGHLSPRSRLSQLSPGSLRPAPRGRRGLSEETLALAGMASAPRQINPS